MRGDRRELALAGRLAAEADQASAAYADTHRVRPDGLAGAISEYVTRDLGHSPTMATEEVEALVHEAALLGLLVGVRVGAARRR